MKSFEKAKRHMLGYADNMRQKPTYAEKIFRDLIRERVPGVQSQVVIDNKYILDFFHAPSMICFEIDGKYHNSPEQMNKDKIRDQYVLKKYGIKTIRFTNDDMYIGRKELAQKVKDSLEYGYALSAKKPKLWGHKL